MPAHAGIQEPYIQLQTALVYRPARQQVACPQTLLSFLGTIRARAATACW